MYEQAISNSSLRIKLDAYQNIISKHLMLSLYCYFEDEYNPNKNHWKSEIRAFVAKLSSPKLKSNNSYLNRKKLVERIWIDELEIFSNISIKTIKDWIHGDEKIDINLTKEFIKMYKFGIGIIIECISKQDMTILNKYLENI